jgi:3'-5' exoribonuclease 1
MRYVIVDLEASCWETGADRLKSEIVEIGAVLLESSEGPMLREFSSFVKPVASQKLSDFCRKLRGCLETPRCRIKPTDVP